MFNWYNTHWKCNICENRKNFETDVEDLSLLEFELLQIRTKIKDFNTAEKCSSITKPNLLPSFQIITEDVQTFLEVMEMLLKQVCMK